MIHPYKGIATKVEQRISEAYASLYDYAQRDNANKKAVWVRQRLLDTFTDGWNLAEDYILKIEAENERLKADLLRQEQPKQPNIDFEFRRCVMRLTQIDISKQVFDSEKERKRDKRLQEVKSQNPHLF